MSYIISCHCFTTIVNSGGFGARSDGATPISNSPYAVRRKSR
ncbi:MAG: hypothetical protein QMO91_03375 [Candidatus Tisiphia sp.]|nr:hypothetical protein [Candidatus Tisiphia sp.]